VAKLILRSPALVFTDHGRYRPEPRSRGLIERHFYYRHTDRLVAVSSDLADYLEDFLELARRPDIVANGIDLETYGPQDPPRHTHLRARWGISDDEVLAISVGRLEPVKNHAAMIAAVAEAAEKVPQIRLAIAGTGGLEAGLKARAKELGLGNRVLFLGHRRDIPDCLRAADLFVSSSTSEGQPVSLLEAMAAGLPVIATAVGGVPEALGSPPPGLLVPPGSTRRLADAVVELANDPARRLELGTAARSRARSFSLDACIERYSDLYDELLSSRADPARV
jgi:glycosyltransferase involved in cell wall biosynthesis